MFCEMAYFVYQDLAVKARAFVALSNYGRNPKNLARDMKKHILRGVNMPEIFWWKVPTWDKNKACQVVVLFPFLLPHEMLRHMVNKNGVDDYFLGMESTYGPFAHSVMSKLGLSLDTCVALGFHGDGVPYSKSDSIEILSWNILSIPGMDRVPFTAISKQYICKCGCLGRHTYNSMLEVMKWSMLQLYIGRVSKFLPDGTEWERSSKHLPPGTELPVALLIQARGDWPFLKQLFQVPQWNQEHICWLCRATKETYKITHSHSTWRTQRYAPNQFFHELREGDRQLCPLLELPGFSFASICLDWMHIMDLGVSPLIMGSLFFELISSSVAMQCLVIGVVALSTQAERVAALWQCLRAWYSENKQPSMLNNLTKEMISNDQKVKLRAKAGECRYLVPFCVYVTRKVQHLGEHWMTVAGLFQYLYKLQIMVSGLAEWDAAEAAEFCRLFCSLFEALSREAEEKGKHTWSMKPKLHLMQESCLQFLRALGLGPDLSGRVCIRVSLCGVWVVAFEVLLRPPQSLLSTVVLCFPSFAKIRRCSNTWRPSSAILENTGIIGMKAGSASGLAQAISEVEQTEWRRWCLTF